MTGRRLLWCPACQSGDALRFLTAWPSWYRPPEGTTHIVQCDCGTILGSVQPEAAVAPEPAPPQPTLFEQEMEANR